MPISPNPTDVAANADVQALLLAATQAHAALMRGDSAGYRSFISLGDDFTLMAPMGGPPSRGGNYSDDEWAAIGRFFRNGRDSTLELVQAYRCDDMVVLAAIERTRVGVADLPEQDWALRVTLVFRRDREQWRLVHRHADPLAGGISVAESAELGRRAAAQERT